MESDNSLTHARPGAKPAREGNDMKSHWILDSQYGVVPKRTSWTLLFAIGILIGLIVFGAGLWFRTTPQVMPGDVNRDGRVNAIDLTMMRRHLIGMYDLTPSQIRIGDVNGNGRIDERDIDMLTDIIMERPVRTYEN